MAVPKVFFRERCLSVRVVFVECEPYSNVSIIETEAYGSRYQ